MIELLASMLILATGIAGLVGTLSGSRDLTSHAELKEAAVHRAEREIERLQALDFEKVAHLPGSIPAPTTGDPDDPKSRIVAPTSGSEHSFRWNRKDASQSEVLVEAEGGEVALGPSDFDDGRFTGDVHRFVTWARDPACAAGAVAPSLCQNERNYKRVTIVVRVRGNKNDLKAIWFSTISADPKDGTVDSETGPVTECLSDDGSGLEECANSASEAPTSFYLHDTPATFDARQSISGSHESHPTVACLPGVTVGCPLPDLMADERPPAAETQLHKYSTEVSGGYTAGRALRRDVDCTGTPTDSDNTKGAFWATSPRAADVTLTGNGALSLHSHTLGGVSASAEICIAVYVMGGDLGTLGTTAPTEIGRSSYSLASWPRTPANVAFSFSFSEESRTVAAGQRIGVRIWISGSAEADLALLYDHPTYASYVQLNEPGS